ncbi:hypothetical protein MNBD_NITROSPIRAE02-36 [hydrothermal vent metagenome]|uniref:Uncharacterized protein n=1 Tax=hydrothermal vent metagenome TaxID=652676 RepID=A0A3B1D8I6_9ZZZZ
MKNSVKINKKISFYIGLLFGAAPLFVLMLIKRIFASEQR